MNSLIIRKTPTFNKVFYSTSQIIKTTEKPFVNSINCKNGLSFVVGYFSGATTGFVLWFYGVRPIFVGF